MNARKNRLHQRPQQTGLQLQYHPEDALLHARQKRRPLQPVHQIGQLHQTPGIGEAAHFGDRHERYHRLLSRCAHLYFLIHSYVYFHTFPQFSILFNTLYIYIYIIYRLYYIYKYYFIVIVTPLSAVKHRLQSQVHPPGKSISTV